MRAADVMESFDAVAQGLDLDESFVEFVSEKPVFAPQRVNGVGQWLMGRGHYLTPRAVLIGLRPKAFLDTEQRILASVSAGSTLERLKRETRRGHRR